MQGKNMQLDIISPEKKVYSGQIKSIQLPGIKGSFGMLNNHAPLISSLKKGSIKVTTMDNLSENFTINGGIVEMLGNKVTVLAE